MEHFFQTHTLDIAAMIIGGCGGIIVYLQSEKQKKEPTLTELIINLLK